MNIYLRQLELDDLDAYLSAQLPHRAYHRMNGPYFPKASQAELKEQMACFREMLSSGKTPLPHKKIIASRTSDVLIGEVNWYWKSKETNWLEIGIVIFDENFWGKGIGCIALKQWIDHLFTEKPALVRIGLTTWSGNTAMMRLAEKLQMRKEAQYRKARIVDGQYHDSVSYGILKEEWEAISSSLKGN